MFLSGRDLRALHGRLDSIDAGIKELKKGQDKIMAQIDDLNAAIQAENVAITNLTGAISAEEARVTATITALQSANATTPNPAVASAITQLQATAANLATISIGLTSFDATS